MIQALTSNEQADPLDNILTVDIFNEGVDIPEINQVIMLRPTESPVAFIQQLGRGLRKFQGKEFVVILDFISNYDNNFMIPIALSGDRSYNKDAMRRYIREGTRIIPGSSTIHFDEISKRWIYASVDKAKTNAVQLLKEAYYNLKKKLGRIPSIRDFGEYGSVDITKIFYICGSYYAFLKKYDVGYPVTLTGDQEIIIEYLSKKVIFYKRIQDITLLKVLVEQEMRGRSYQELLRQEKDAVSRVADEESYSYKDYIEPEGNQIIELQIQREHDLVRERELRLTRQQYADFLKDAYGVSLSARTEESVYRNLTNVFPQEAEQKKYAVCILIERDEEGTYCLTERFRDLLRDDSFRDMVLELLQFARDHYEEHYAKLYKDTNLNLYQRRLGVECS